MKKSYLEKIFKIPRIAKVIIQILTDALIILLCLFFSMALRLDTFNFLNELYTSLILIFLIPITILIYSKLGFYKSIIRFISEKIFFKVGLGVFLSSLTLFLGSKLLEFPLPRSVPFIYFTFMFITTISIRFFLKNIYILHKFDYRKPIAIYGAGEAGRALLATLDENFKYDPLLFIDDNINLSNSKINELNVFQLDESIKILQKLKIKLVLLALPSISISKRTDIINRLEKHSLEVKTIPSMNDLINGKAEISDIFSLTIEDLLERKEVPSKINLMKKNIIQKTVLVTGSGGSIGSELCRQILKIMPKTLIYLDNSEYALYKIDSEIKKYIKEHDLQLTAIPVLGSIQDISFLKNFLKKYKIETIYHSAAFKHVPIVEFNIIEAIKNNVFGTKLITDLAIDFKVKDFILISTDKAVRPTNYMGATKRIAELICQSASEYQKNTIFSIVRFGNVMGSSGSVIPLFEDQIKKGGPIYVTHKDITRYFMTIKEAVGLVIQAGAMARSGDLFILDMGKPVKILDLAMKMIRLYGKTPLLLNNCKHYPENNNIIEIKITKLRPGEKIFEELLIDHKSSKTKHPRIYKAREKSIKKLTLDVLLKNLTLFCKEDNLQKIKNELENAELGFDTRNNHSDQM